MTWWTLKTNCLFAVRTLLSIKEMMIYIYIISSSPLAIDLASRGACDLSQFNHSKFQDPCLESRIDSSVLVNITTNSLKGKK